jgi:hypothetical protein
MPYCDECGEELRVGDKFCPNCGTPISAIVVRTLKKPEPVRTSKRSGAPKRIEEVKAVPRITPRIDVLRERAVAARHNRWMSLVCFLIGLGLGGAGLYLLSITTVGVEGTFPYFSYVDVRPYENIAAILLLMGGILFLGGIIGSAIYSAEHGRIMREIEELNRRS